MGNPRRNDSPPESKSRPVKLLDGGIFTGCQKNARGKCKKIFRTWLALRAEVNALISCSVPDLESQDAGKPGI